MVAKKPVKPAQTLRGQSLYEFRYKDFQGTERMLTLAASDEIEAITLVKRRFGYMTFASLTLKQSVVYVPTGVE